MDARICERYHRAAGKIGLVLNHAGRRGAGTRRR